jgi:hypothetical protein
MTLEEIAKSHDTGVATMVKDYKQYWRNIQKYIGSFPMIDERYQNDTIEKLGPLDIKLTHLGFLKFDKNIRYKYMVQRRRALYKYWGANNAIEKISKHKKQIKKINYEN